LEQRREKQRRKVGGEVDRSRSVKAQGLPDQQREQVVDALGEVD
jgi:hypothetical protein